MSDCVMIPEVWDHHTVMGVGCSWINSLGTGCEGMILFNNNSLA